MSSSGRSPAAQSGSGLPDGGTAGQVLVKTSGTDGDAGWSAVDKRERIVVSGRTHIGHEGFDLIPATGKTIKTPMPIRGVDECGDLELWWSASYRGGGEGAVSLPKTHFYVEAGLVGPVGDTIDDPGTPYPVQATFNGAKRARVDPGADVRSDPFGGIYTLDQFPLTMTYYVGEGTIGVLGAAISTTGATSITGPQLAVSHPLYGKSFYLQIDDEYMLATAGTDGTSWTVTRAQGGTTAATHSNGADVGHVIEVPSTFTTASLDTNTVSYDGNQVMNTSPTPDGLAQHNVPTPNMMTARIFPAGIHVVALRGNSNTYGQNQNNPTVPTDVAGFAERACQIAGLPCVQMASAGTGLNFAIAQPYFYWRRVRDAGVTIITVELGTNRNNETAAELIAQTEAEIAFALSYGLLPVVCTIPPYLDPGDDPVIDDAIQGLWAAVRAGLDGAAWTVDIASAVQADENGNPDLTGLYWGDDGDGVMGNDLHISFVGREPAAVVFADGLTHLKNGERGGISQATDRFTPAAPVNTAAPSISGSANAGSTLTCTPGSWPGFPIPTVTRQWRKDGVAIPGETGLTYDTVDPGDIGGVIDVLETATNTQGSASEGSNDITVVTPPDVFDPDTITNLVTRNVAADIGTGAVASWPATVSGTALAQATSGSRPVRGTVDGAPGVSLDGLDDNLVAAITLTQPFEVWLVLMVLHAGKNPASGQDECLWGSDSGAYGGAWWSGTGSSGLIKLTLGTDLISSSVTLNDGLHVVRFLANGGSSKIDVDGANVASGDAGAGNPTSFMLGDTFSSGFPANFAVSERVVIGAVSTTGDRSDFLAYAQATYGTP